jgi:hypothetical protein
VTEPSPGSDAPRLDSLVDADLLVPIRSSSGEAPDPERVTPEAYRHGVDESGERFIAAFSSAEALTGFGPPGSDHVVIPARELFERAEAAHERVVIDPGAPTQVEVSVGLLPFLAAGIDPNRPDAMRARRPVGGVPPLAAPADVPEPFGTALRSALEDLPQVERAWLLRAGDAWTAGIQLVPDAVLGDFDAVRNSLHAVATEHLGSRRALAVTDLRAPSLREEYDATAAPFYVRRTETRSFLAKLIGR